MFREDLCRELRHWRSLGDQVLLMMDANENVLEGAMVKKMAKPDIGLRAAVHSQVPGHGPKTHIPKGRNRLMKFLSHQDW